MKTYSTKTSLLGLFSTERISMASKIWTKWLCQDRAAKIGVLLTVVLALAPSVFALDGQIGIHDPSTVTECDGKYYTYGTGGTPLVSDDGWIWRSGVTPLRTGAAPDVIHIGDRYYMYISGVTMIWSKTLDPDSPDYKWEDGGTIAG